MTTMPIETKIKLVKRTEHINTDGKERMVKVKHEEKHVIYADGTTLIIRSQPGYYGKLSFIAFLDGEEVAWGSISEASFPAHEIPAIYGTPNRDYTDDDPEDEEYTRWTKVPYIVAVGTAGNHRRRGFGTQIMLAMHEHLIKEGEKCVTLNATSDGEKLYRTLGYQPVRPVGSSMVKYFGEVQA